MAQSNATTEEMNLAIAEFMKLEKDHHAYLTEGRFRTEYLVNGYWLPLRKLKYHASWDWLMPVVEKIGNISVKSSASYNHDLQFRIEIVNGYTKIEGTREAIFFNSSIEGTMLMATYKAVYQFITWYNQQKQPNDH